MSRLLSRQLLISVHPQYLLLTPTYGEVLTTSTVDVQWSGSDAGSGIAYYLIRLDDGAWINVGTTTSHTFTAVADGIHVVYVITVDNVRNSAMSCVMFEVDTKAFSKDHLEDITIIILTDKVGGDTVNVKLKAHPSKSLVSHRMEDVSKVDLSKNVGPNGYFPKIIYGSIRDLGCIVFLAIFIQRE